MLRPELSSEAYKQWRQLGFDLAPIGSSQATPASSKPKSTKGLLFIVASLLRGEAEQQQEKAGEGGEAKAERIDSTGFGRVWFGMQLKTSAAAVARAMPTGQRATANLGVHSNVTATRGTATATAAAQQQQQPRGAQTKRFTKRSF